MIGDDPFADGEAETCTLSFAEGSEGFEESVGHFRGDPFAGVFDFGGDGLGRDDEADKDFTAVGHHGIHGIVDEVEENVGETGGIDEELEVRCRIFEFESDVLHFDLGSELLDNLLHVGGVIGLGQHIGALRTACELQQFIDHVAEAIDLFPDPVFGGQPQRGWGGFGAAHFGGDTDDVEGVLEVVDDGAGEPAYERETFGLEDLADVLSVEIAHAEAELAHEADGHFGGVFESVKHFLPRNEPENDIGFGESGAGSGFIIEDGHFTEEITG